MLQLRSRPAFLLLDALVGAAVFAILLGAVGFSLFASQRSAVISGEYQRAIALAESAIEAVRSMRDADFDSIIDGQHGLQVGPSGQWEFSGTETITADGFSTSVTVTPIEDGHSTIVARTTWTEISGKEGSVTLSSELTDWRKEFSMGNWANMQSTEEGLYVDTGTPLFTALAVVGDTLFAASQQEDGLYIFDISDTANPTRIASSFTLGGDAAYDIANNGSILYIATSNSSAELQIYDASDPLNLTLLGSADVPGDGRARTLALYTESVFLGATEDLTEDEFYAYDVADPEAVTLLDSVDDEGGGYNDVVLHEGYAYLAGSSDLSELTVIDIFDPSDLSDIGGFPLTDVYDATAITAYGSSVLIGRVSGTTTEEAIEFDISEGPIPESDPPPLYGEMGGTVYAIEVDPTGTYAFITTDEQTDHGDDEIFYQALKVVEIDNFPIAVDRFETDTTTGIGYGRAVYYDIIRDRIFLATDSAIFILAPGV